jgi:membrane protease YdiL (CAAX protease family)
MIDRRGARAPTVQSVSSVRRGVAEHPIASFLIIGNGVYVAIALTPPLREAEIWFELPLFATLGTILGVGLAAFLVTAAADGRAGAVDLLRRCLRWRVPLRWYAIALLVLPAATTLIALAIYGTEALESPPEGWLHVLGVVLGVFVLQLILFQFAEEAGWTGFFQERLSSRYTPLKLSAVVAFFWAVWHVPDFFVDEGFGVEQVVTSLVFLAIEFVLLFFARVLIVWMYERTGRSVFLVIVFHAGFDATISELSRELIPDSDAVRFILVNGVIVAAAAVVIFVTRGRLAARRDDVMRPAATPT